MKIVHKVKIELFATGISMEMANKPSNGKEGPQGSPKS
jgi:hypothetical protein